MPAAMPRIQQEGSDMDEECRRLCFVQIDHPFLQSRLFIIYHGCTRSYMMTFSLVVFLLHSVFSCFLNAAGWICLNQTQLGISAFLLVKGLQSAKTESFSWGATLRPSRRCCKKRRRRNAGKRAWDVWYEMSDRLHRASQKGWVARLFKVVHAF